MARHIPADATIIETGTQKLEDGAWFAAIKYKRPTQGDPRDIWRTFRGPGAHEEAEEWLMNKRDAHVAAKAAADAEADLANSEKENS